MGYASLYTSHLKPNTYFEDILERYTFDRHLRLILFGAIERIKVALRTKMIYYLSMAYGGLWHLNPNLFETKPLPSNPYMTIYQNTIVELKKEFFRSQEIFIKDQRQRYPEQDADAWKIMEVASMGTLSKLYKNLKHQLPEKATIANKMGLNLHSELSSWLEAIGLYKEYHSSSFQTVEQKHGKSAHSKFEKSSFRLVGQPHIPCSSQKTIFNH